MAQKLVDDFIANNKVMVFSKSYCPYCSMAKSAFDQTGVTYKALELDERGDGDAIQDYLLQLTKGRSVPRCFVGGKFIGGGTDVKALQDQGKLVPLLQKAGAL